ncbi:hypothetical protein ACSNOK_26790 [Streptomyces sp. URMC 126]|uniref:hypothetical protein n=1 Tax=Streptomyces sp. URMC 126 TaxID=3423401 RepID=UPI003F1A7CA2
MARPVYAWPPPGGDAADAADSAPADVSVHGERAAAGVPHGTRAAVSGPAPPGAVLRLRTVREAAGPASDALAHHPDALRHTRRSLIAVRPDSDVDLRAAPVPAGTPRTDAPPLPPAEAGVRPYEPVAPVFGWTER